MKIVTGYTGTPHVSSNDDQGFHQGIFGAGNNILNVGSKFAAELIDATTITIADGEGMLQGVHFRVAPGTVDTVNIDAGVVGYNRIDLICARYTKDANSGVESVDWYVIKGTPSASTPTAPDAEDGDVLAGDLVADFPMYKVTITGVTPEIEEMFQVYRKTKGYEVYIDGNDGDVYLDFAPGIYAVSGSVRAIGVVVESGQQQLYRIYADGELMIDDRTGQHTLYYNGVIVVDESYPQIIVHAHVTQSGVEGVSFGMDITKIA